MASYCASTAFDVYRQQVSACGSVNHEQEQALARAYKAGDATAGRKLIEAHLRFVISVAREYRLWGVPFEDLVQQGNLGLLKAAQRFDPERETSLISYASYWIRAEIREYVVQVYRIVRLGSTRTERKAIRSYRTHRVENAEELATLSGMPLERCKMLLPLLSARDGVLDENPVGERPRPETASRGPNPEELFASGEEHACAQHRAALALAVLSPRERTIVQERMMNEEPKTLDEIGASMGVSRERVRQLEQRAKLKMRDVLERVA
jgi:RNA polymerase sigma-32 factor